MGTRAAGQASSPGLAPSHSPRQSSCRTSRDFLGVVRAARTPDDLKQRRSISHRQRQPPRATGLFKSRVSYKRPLRSACRKKNKYPEIDGSRSRTPHPCSGWSGSSRHKVLRLMNIFPSHSGTASSQSRTSPQRKPSQPSILRRSFEPLR